MSEAKPPETVIKISRLVMFEYLWCLGAALALAGTIIFNLLSAVLGALARASVSTVNADGQSMAMVGAIALLAVFPALYGLLIAFVGYFVLGALPPRWVQALHLMAVVSRALSADVTPR